MKIYLERVMACLMSMAVFSCLSIYSAFSCPIKFKMAKKVSLFRATLFDLKGGLSSHRARCLRGSPAGEVPDFLAANSYCVWASSWSCFAFFSNSFVDLLSMIIIRYYL